MRTTLGIVFGILVVGVAHGGLTHTTTFKSHLASLVSHGNTLKACLNKVSHPLRETSRFANDVKMVQDLIHKLEGRISGTVDIISVVMLIPYAGAFAAPVLTPVSGVLNTINSGLKKVTHEIDSVVSTIRGWLSPLVTVQRNVAVLNTKITHVLSVISRVESETAKTEKCVMALPGSARNHAEAALENVCKSLDHVPSALLSPVSHVTTGCTKVESFLSKIHLVRRKRGLPSLSKVVGVLKKIDGAFGPVGRFLDKVHRALNKKICLIGAIIKIGKVIVKGVVKGAEAVAHVVVKGAKAVAHGAEVVGKGIAKGAEAVAHGVVSVGKSIGHFFHHLFGRRAIYHEGQVYVILEEHEDTRKRGFDLCFSIHDALKVVNGVTGGILGAAQKFIGGLFHIKSIFHIPGLTVDFFNLGRLLKPFHISFPHLIGQYVLKLSESAVTQALHLNPLLAYAKAVPVCKAAILG